MGSSKHNAMLLKTLHSICEKCPMISYGPKVSGDFQIRLLCKNGLATCECESPVYEMRIFIPFSLGFVTEWQDLLLNYHKRCEITMIQCQKISFRK